MSDKTMNASESPRQKIILGIVVLVMGFLGYQVYHMFEGGSSSETPITPGTSHTAAPQTPTPQPAQLLQTGNAANQSAPMTEREMQLLKLQQETEAKYIAALNELQMLKVQKDIAQTNKDIVTAKVETITAQKNLVTLLSPTSPTPDYSQQVAQGGGAVSSGPQQGIQQQPGQASSYTVVSVSHLQGRWNAVMGYQGKLMNVFIGDTLPADGSKVASIDKSGVTLKLEDGTTKRVSLVTII